MKLVAFVFNHFIEQKFLAGKRSYLAGASSILGGIVVLLEMTAGGTFDEQKAGIGFAAIAFGYKILGDAGKKDKLIAATQALADATVANAPTT